MAVAGSPVLVRFEPVRDNLQFHCDDGPAIAFKDGHEGFAGNGGGRKFLLGLTDRGSIRSSYQSRRLFKAGRDRATSSTSILLAIV